ncbi:MAG: hypothetical protein IJC19_05015, partial [Clostridia bacterium]|nr:hypothetical protein [Clostridia bacterium]
MKKLLVFGEVLFDLFDKEAEIGGAPYNVAAHFSALGGGVDFVSAVGKDALGKDALLHIKAGGIDTRYTALVDAPTGYCRVTLKDGHPSYDLASGVAYDEIPYPEGIDPNEYEGLYFGTLSLRNETSRKTLEKLLPMFSERFYDINVRSPHCPAERIRHFLFCATTVKISREEAPILFDYTDAESYIARLAAEYPNLRRIILTMDKDGSIFFDREKGLFYAPLPKEKPISTVGAGDAHCACCLYHLFKESEPQHMLACAAALADFVITRRGAI